MKLIRVVAAAAFTLIPMPALAADPVPVDPALTQVVEANEAVAPPGTPAEISAGHVDLGPKLIDGVWELMVRDDSTDTPTWRHLDDVVFRVSDEAKTELPENDDQYSFISASGPVWAIPQTEKTGVVWLGWNTQDPALVDASTGFVTLAYEGHEGEGDLNVFVQAGNFSGPQELWNSRKTHTQPIHVDVNTHTHANWVFTASGVHLMRLSAQADLSDGTTVEDTRILRFAVGDETLTEQAREAQWTIENPPEKPAEVAPVSAIDKSTSFPLIIGIGVGACALVAVLVAAVIRSRALKRKADAERTVEGSIVEAHE